MTVQDKPAPALGASTATTPAQAPRLDWVDNLRTLMILLVVNMHACVTYSFVGSWYYNAPPEPSIGAKIPFVLWQATLQSFFMGLLFFVAGYYADRSLTKRGPGPFLQERIRRLGIPTLIYMLVLHPLIVLGMHPGYGASKTPLTDYLHFVTSGKFIGSSGPMWFAFALLIFSALFAAFGSRLPKTSPGPLRLTAWTVVGLGLGVGLASFLVRTVQPLGSSILNFQLCYFAQYVVAFCLGVWTSRRDWLTSIATHPLARRAGPIALVLGPIALVGVIAASLPIPKSGQPAFAGGWNPVAFGLAVWEQLVGVSLGLGAMALSAARLNFRSRVSSWLSDRSFGVYLLHPPILVAISLALQPIRTNPFVMALVVTVLGLGLSFAAADLARRVPGLKSVL